MIGHIITIKGNAVSESSADSFMESAKENNISQTISLFRSDAITPPQNKEIIAKHKLKWTYPWKDSVYDMRSGLKKTAYQTNQPAKRVSCFLSHYLLWVECAEKNKEMFIFEHDALITAPIPLDILQESRHTIIGLNDPRGATRKSKQFHDRVQERGFGVVPCPKVDLDHIPQGLAGNSAYFIKPAGAKKMLALVKEFGAWPNDAIMCRQLLGGALGVLNPYCTIVQGTRSTTTL